MALAVNTPAATVPNVAAQVCSLNMLVAAPPVAGCVPSNIRNMALAPASVTIAVDLAFRNVVL
jgi:hypothetical protein